MGESITVRRGTSKPNKIRTVCKKVFQITACERDLPERHRTSIEDPSPAQMMATLAIRRCYLTNYSMDSDWAQKSWMLGQGSYI